MTFNRALPTVTHILETFVAPSQPWTYDLIQAHDRFRPTVACAYLENEGRFPYDAVREVLPRSRRFDAAWVYANVAERLPFAVKPSNTWRSSLTKLPSTDVFHAHFGPVGWRAVDAGLHPVVTSFYGFDAAASRVLDYWGAGYPQLFRDGQAFVGEGPAMRERLVRLGAPAERTFVLPIVAKVDSLRWEAPTRPKTGVIRVLMAGRLVEKKGFVDGVHAFADAVEMGATARLVIMGDGPEKQSIDAAVRQREIDRLVDFLPAESRETYWSIVRSCQVLLQPSKTARDGDTEGGAPTTILDGQSIGLIVVTTDHADIPFVVDRDSAFISKEGDRRALGMSLRAALDDAGSWSERSAVGRRHVEEQHAPENVIRRLEELYDRIV